MITKKAKAELPSNRPTKAFLISLALLLLGLLPTTGRSWIASYLRTLHTLTPAYSDQNPQPTGYYVGLIDGTSQSRDELTLRLVGKPPETINFIDINAARFLPGDYLQFELLPDIDTEVFNSHFTTNAFALRDRPYTQAKQPGTFRIVLLGASMDMGWGVGTLETYENQFEDWLNAHAAKRGLNRRFEVLNLAVAAYSPLHRLESFRRKAAAFQPDMVLYAATRLDTRLLQLHINNLLNDGVAIPVEFVRTTLEAAGIDPTPSERMTNGKPKPRDKELLKQHLEPILWDLNDQAVQQLGELCRSMNLPLACLIIPRAGGSDSQERRGPDVEHILSNAQRCNIPVLDLSASYDHEDLMAVEIAPWDDHPNGLGHRLLFLEIGRRLILNPDLYRTIFNADPAPGWPKADPGSDDNLAHAGHIHP